MSDRTSESTIPNEVQVTTAAEKQSTNNGSGGFFGSEHIVFLVIGCMVLFFMVCLPIDFYKYHKRRKDKKDRQGSSTVYSRTGPGPFLVPNQDNQNEQQTSNSRSRRHPFFKFIGLITLLKKKPAPSSSADVTDGATALACSGEQIDVTADDSVTPSTSTRSMSMSTMPRNNSVGPSCDSVSPAAELPDLSPATTAMIQCEVLKKLKGNGKLTGQVNSGMTD